MDNAVVELFAGVGGFRLGLEESGWNVIYANQWEPGKKVQHAFDCYSQRFQEGKHTNVDIATVHADEIPEHTLLVGGFPCQDYSVASTLSNSKGLKGKKGVLWWEILRIVTAKLPKYILLENVDRLLKSPASQRGRDFAIILACLNEIGYSVEWRVINAAEYGFVQRRRRVYIFATKLKNIQKELYKENNLENSLLTSSLFAKSFPVEKEFKGNPATSTLPKDLLALSDNYSFEFQNSGICFDYTFVTGRTIPSYDGFQSTLGDVLEKDVNEKFYIKPEELPVWKYMKGGKKEKRVTKTGYEYNYAEGPIAFPDPLNKPSRTMLTSESSKNRSSHIVEDSDTEKLRKLTPVECERLNGFPDNWTDTMPDRARYFCMGNALVIGVIKKLGKTIIEL